MAVLKGRFKTNTEREEEKKKQTSGYFVLPTFEELQAIEQEAKEDAAKAVSSDGGLDFFQKPSNWDDGYQFGDITKTALGTLGDVGVGAVKGVMKMGEGIGDAAQYGVAALADLFGADDAAEAIRRNAQQEKVANAFSGVDKKLDKYSVLGHTSDAAAESLGQIGGILATGGLAGAAGLGAAGTTAVTTGVMGASSFGSGTSEAYAAGAEEGEAEAYGAIAGAADALSEMIFGGLGKGVKALGLSKGLSSADDMLAKAVSSKIKNTLAKNTVQLGVKAGAEGLEEVLAGTMQAAGKKMTYMSERDFLDILEDENLLEQFVVGSLASGIAQAPGYVSANRAGADLVSDGGTEGVGGAEDTRESTNPRIEEIERTGRSAGADDGTIALARDVSSLTGRGVRFFSEAENDGYINNGFWDPDSNTININVKSKNPSAQILSHELTHSIENTDSYLQLRSVIFDRMKRDGMDIDAEYRKKEMLYNDAGYRLRDEGEIAHEIIAEQIEKRYLTDEASIRSLVSENRTLGQRIREWFDSLLAKMGNAEAKERDYVRQVRDLYAKALGEGKTGDGTSEAQYHISKHFGREIDIALNPKLTGTNQVKARDYTPKILVDHGVKNKPMLMTRNHVRSTILTEDEAKVRGLKTGKGINYHGLGKKLLMKTIDNLDKPNEIYKKNDDTYLIVTRTKDQSGNEIIVPVRIDGTGVYNDVYIEENHILSAYGKKNLDAYLARNGFELIYKKSDTTLNKGVQYSNVGDTADNSISQVGGNVNREFSVSEVAQDSEGRQLSDGQREYFRDSKVTDANGNLKVMYHGTAGEGFTVFDKRKAKSSGTFGNGFYFSDSKSHAGQYGKTYEVYLNITNPLSGGTKTITEDQMRDFVEAVAENEDYGIENYGYGATVDSVARSLSSKTDFEALMDINLTCIGNMAEALQLFGEVTGRKYDGIITPMETVVFDPEQIKNIDNLNPTSNPDIRYSVSKSDDPDNKRVMPKRSAAGTKARARQDQQTRMRFEQKVMNRGFDNLSPAEQEHYRDEIVGQYRRKYDDYKKKRDALTASGYQFAGVDDYVEKVVGSVEDAAIDANTFLVHYQEGVFGDPTREDVQDFALDYLQMIGAHRPDTSETYVETQDSAMPGDEDAPPERTRGVQMEYGEPEAVDVDGEGEPKLTRKVLHKTIMDGIKEQFSKRGLDLDRVLAKAKDLSTFSTVDNTPQRVMEKSLGYQAGQALSDLTVNRVAENETAGIRWLNQYTSKDGVIAGLAKKYNIKPGSKESAAAQMYAEGFYVNEYDEIVEYGDRELAADFPDAQVQKNIKGLARDPVIRQIYDQTLDAINASRARNAYPEIQKLDNYYLHFRAMDDTFSRLGVPFNPNDIRAKDLPTDLNGVTADLKPGQPYFASAMHRKGKRTSFDLLGGLEKYLTSAKNQIYHIDDIQTLRALRNYIADMYGQGNGLQGLDDMDEDAVQERIKQVYDSHLSTFAKFLNEEANIIAGKTSLIDRGLEGVIGRRGITFLNDVNRQVGANMVGWNVSSSLTNVLPVVQAFAKTNKLAFVKGFSQTVQNRLASITGQGDGFAETSDVIVRRKGADRYHRTPWQKASDAGYLLMGMVDDISTEIIARAKYNELTAKGMDAEAANRETDKWVSRLMGDRSLGQMPQIFNSKMLGMITKFQLEVRNQIDAQFYDTIKEAQADYAEIGDKAKRNAKIAAKVTATFAELAIAQHLFGAIFESIAGYNPAFDIIEVLAKVIGLDDDEESEDTVLDNIEQGVLALIEDLPYSSVLMDGGRVPISAAMPIGDIIKGEDQYGNEVSRLQTAAEALPYYVLPGGYGQIKKTAQGLSMFTGDKPVTGSYTDSGNLRFPVEATPGNVAQAAVFGQWSNENARDYFDNERKPISERQAQGYAESDLEWKEYQKYKAQITKLEKGADKVSAIKELDISLKAKEALYRSLVATTVKDEEGNIIGTSEDGKIEALYNAGLDFNDFLDVKMKQASLNADESLSGNGRATRFLAWVSQNGYTDAQADVIGEQFPFSSGFRVSPTTYQKMVDGGVEPDNAVAFSDALSGTERAIDKINAMWGTGIGGKQLDAAIKAVVSEKQYENYHIIIDANVPLDAYTWVLDNADIDGNGSISNEEREVTLSRLALDPSDLSALWLATGGSEKSNPYKGSAFGIKMPEINIPQIDMPELDFDIPHFDFEFNFGGNKT